VAKENGLKPLARVVAYAEAGRAPVDFTVAPVNATEQLLAKAGIDKSKVARWEVNEAFSITALAFIKIIVTFIPGVAGIAGTLTLSG